MWSALMWHHLLCACWANRNGQSQDRGKSKPKIAKCLRRIRGGSNPTHLHGRKPTLRLVDPHKSGWPGPSSRVEPSWLRPDRPWIRVTQPVLWVEPSELKSGHRIKTHQVQCHVTQINPITTLASATSAEPDILPTSYDMSTKGPSPATSTVTLACVVNSTMSAFSWTLPRQ